MTSDSDILKQCQTAALKPLLDQAAGTLPLEFSLASLLESPALQRTPYIQQIVRQPNISGHEVAVRGVEDSIRAAVFGRETYKWYKGNPVSWTRDIALYLGLNAVFDVARHGGKLAGFELDYGMYTRGGIAAYTTADERGAARHINTILSNVEDIDRLPPDLRLLAEKQRDIKQLTSTLASDFPTPGTSEFTRMPREQRLAYERRALGLRDAEFQSLEMAHQYVQERIKQLGENATPAQVLQLATAAIAVGCHHTPAPDTGTISAELHPSGVTSTRTRAEIAAAVTLP